MQVSRQNCSSWKLVTYCGFFKKYKEEKYLSIFALNKLDIKFVFLQIGISSKVIHRVFIFLPTLNYITALSLVFLFSSRVMQIKGFFSSPSKKALAFSCEARASSGDFHKIHIHKEKKTK